MAKYILLFRRPGPGQTMMTNTVRRDSSWTVSTEGYGSMRSGLSAASRRGSEMSAMSAGSARQAGAGTPAWDPISPGSSRRSSEAGARASPVMSHHLTKLHKKALAAGTNSSLASQVNKTISKDTIWQYILSGKRKDWLVCVSSVRPGEAVRAGHCPPPLSLGRQSQFGPISVQALMRMCHDPPARPIVTHHHLQGTSSMTIAGDLMTSGGLGGAGGGAGGGAEEAGRRMSDPVRPLDRNFGVGGQLSRHRSYSNLDSGAGRAPLHQQRVRGQQGWEQQPAQYPAQVRHHNLLLFGVSCNYLSFSYFHGWVTLL